MLVTTMDNKENAEPQLNPVRVVIRERPPSSTELSDGDRIIQIDDSNKNIIVVNGRFFAFDKVFTADLTQADMFEELAKPLVPKFLKGFSCTILAYGQTGTGKTFSMGLLPENFHNKNAGIITRVLDDVFSLSYVNPEIVVVLSISFIEIYNEKVYDLLAANKMADPLQAKGFKGLDITKQPISMASDAYKILLEGKKNRHVRPTKLNGSSSRSHAIFTIHASIKSESNEINSVFHLVDLAGSEGVRRTGHQGLALSEGIHINQGLLSIAKVFQALSIGNKCIPYRDSVLSTVLQDSLTVNGYLALLACVSPSKDDVHETLSTLRFAQSATSLKNQPQLQNAMASLKKKHSMLPKTPICGRTHVKSSAQSSTTPGIIATWKRSNTTLMDAGVRTPVRSNSFCTPNKQKMKSTLSTQKTASSQHNDHDITSTLISAVNEKVNSLCLSSTNHEMITSTANTSFASAAPSYSPIIRRCIDEMQNQFEKIVIRALQNRTITANGGPPLNATENGHETVTLNPLQPLSVFKIPTIPSTASEILAPVDNLQVRPNRMRRSQRLASITDAPCSTPFCEVDQSVLSIEDRMSMSSVSRTIIAKPRRSIRLSIQESQQKQLEAVTHLTTVPAQAKENQKPVSNNNYYHKLAASASKRTAHSAVILELLNNGSLKELQILPQVGLKTAFQLITYRTMHGKYSKLKDVAKVPVWRGKAWDRFMVANNLG